MYSYCGGNSNDRIYGYTRDYEERISQKECLDSCVCETVYILGLITNRTDLIC